MSSRRSRINWSTLVPHRPVSRGVGYGVVVVEGVVPFFCVVLVVVVGRLCVAVTALCDTGFNVPVVVVQVAVVLLVAVVSLLEILFTPEGRKLREGELGGLGSSTGLSSIVAIGGTGLA